MSKGAPQEGLSHDLTVPSFEFLQKRIRQLYPSIPSAGKVPKYAPQELTPKQKAVWRAVVDTVRGGSGGAAPTPAPEREN